MDPDQFLSALVSSIGNVPVGKGTLEETLRDTARELVEAGDLVLLFDDFDRVVAHQARLIAPLLEGGGDSLRLLVTSREILRHPEELAYELLPLALPKDSTDPQTSAAFQLLLERSRRYRRSFPEGPEETADAVDLLRRLDGMPLPIEIVAPRVALLGAASVRNALRDATIGKVENMVTRAEERMKDGGRSIVSTIRDNPVPTAVVGVGLAWLIYKARAASRREAGREMQGGRSPSLEARVSEMATGIGHEIGDVASSIQRDVHDKAVDAKGAIGDLAGTVGHRASMMAHDAKDAVGELGHAAAQRARHLAQGAKEQGVRLEKAAESTFESNPLAVGAALLAVGALVGFALPSTKKEDQWMGGVRDEAVRRAERLAGDALGKIQVAARDLGESAVERLDAAAT